MRKATYLTLGLFSIYNICSAATISSFGPQLLCAHASFPKMSEFVTAKNPEGSFLIDASFSTLKRPDGNTTFLSSNWGSLYKFEGRTDNPTNNGWTTNYWPNPLNWGGQVNFSTDLAATPIYAAWTRGHTKLWLNEPNLRDDRADNPGTANWSAWIPNIYQRSNGDLLGFVHIEDYSQCYPTDPSWPECNEAGGARQKRFRIGLAYSRDRGETWTYCGHILKPYSDVIQSNIGGVPYLVVNQGGVDYFYVYFNEYGGGNASARISVARAVVSDVLAAAQNGTVTNWTKMGGTPAAPNWNQNGFTGIGSNIITNPAPGFPLTYGYDAHSDAAKEVGNLNKFLLLLNANNPSASNKYGLCLFSSADGVNWNPEQVLETSQTDKTFFSTFVGGTNSNNDNSQVGDVFDIMYVRRYDNTINDQTMDLYSRQITILP